MMPSPTISARGRAPSRAVLLAATLSLLPLPLLAQSTADSADAGNMVAAQAILSHALDARTMQPGASFDVKLDQKVRLSNGTELPGNTILHGAVATDDTNASGNAKLALRFTSAQLKNGQTLPIRATIVGLETPADQSQILPAPNQWQPSQLVVDQFGVSNGVDLHSRVDGQNSGLFVSTTREDVKLAAGSAIDLAIAPGQTAQAGN